MCDPIAAAGAAMQIGGMAANSIGASAASSARQRALQNNVMGQMANQQAAFGEVDKGRAQYENFAPGMQKRGAEIGDIVQGNVNQNAPSAMPASNNVTTQDAAGSAAAKTTGQTLQRGRAMAENMQFGDYLAHTGMKAGRNLERAGMLNNFARGDASLLPGQLEAANHAGDTWAGIGSIANGLGRLGVQAGIARMYTPLPPPMQLQGATTFTPMGATVYPTGPTNGPLSPIY